MIHVPIANDLSLKDFVSDFKDDAKNLQTMIHKIMNRMNKYFCNYFHCTTSMGFIIMNQWK